jgi:hypothetical protein
MAVTGYTWRVIGQSETSASLPDGTFGAGFRVSFQTSDGLTGSVFVPKRTYNKPNVLAAIKEQAAQMHEIQGLTGSE